MAAPRFGPSKLVEAIRNGRLDQLISALDEGADIEEADIHGFAGLPLRTACFAGHVPIIRELLARGANVNACTADGAGAPLRLALRAGHTEIAALLLSRAAQIPFDLTIDPAILERAHQLTQGGAPAEAVPSLEFTPHFISQPSPPVEPEPQQHHDNMIEFIGAASDDNIEQVDVKACYGVDTNILSLDFERASGNWEKVPPATTGSHSKNKGD